MSYIWKGPDDKTPIPLDWSDFLGDAEISTVTWEADSGITLSDESNTSTTATNYVSGGTLGNDYNLRCTVTTNESVARIESRSIEIRVVRKR